MLWFGFDGFVEVVLNIPEIKNDDFYVIGDVHGCAVELQMLLAQLPLSSTSGVVLLGDYIDRGPASRDVVDALLRLRRQVDVYALLGNHEQIFLDYFDHPTPENRARFVFNGGGATLQSYRSAAGELSIPREHLAFFRSLRLCYQSKSHIFVHAGLPAKPLESLSEASDRETMLWVRSEFHRSNYRWDKTVVHGHSHVPAVFRDDRRINIDTGCVFNGKLTALHVPSGLIYQVVRFHGAGHQFLKEHHSSRREAVRFDGRLEVLFSEPSNLPAFHTLNYNDFGFLVTSEHHKDRVLGVNDEVAGTLLPHDELTSVAFRGVVVRVDAFGAAVRYAICFHKPANASA